MRVTSGTAEPTQVRPIPVACFGEWAEEPAAVQETDRVDLSRKNKH